MKDVPQVSMACAPQKQGRSFGTIFLGVCILMMSIVSIWAVLKKSGHLPVSNQSHFEVQVTPPVLPQPPVPQPDVHNALVQFDQRLSTVEKNQHVWAFRSWLMGLAINENVNLTRRIQDRQGIADPGYIVFDEQWKINRKPSTLKLTDEQKERLNEAVK